jgi:hypothetical protein
MGSKNPVLKNFFEEIFLCLHYKYVIVYNICQR